MSSLKSSTLRSMYKEWQATATPEQVRLVDDIFAECEKHYEDGGDTIVETFTPAEIVREFQSVADAKDYCGFVVEQGTNARWGEDDDPELKRQGRFEQW